MNENDNCMVCGEYMGTFKNELQTSTAYSERTILEIIEKFFDSEISPEVAETEFICTNCFIKFNEYDELQTKADMIYAEIMATINSKEGKVIEEIKVEEEAPEEQIIYTVYNENMVEVKDDQIQELIMPEIKHPVETSSLKASPSKSKRQRTNNTKSDKDEGFNVTMIDGVKHYSCELCFKNFINRSRLKAHRLIHSTERNFRCSECGADFKTSSCLKNHSRLHKNIFFHCDLCGRHFKGKHELKCHVEAIHLMRMDHKCHLCGKAFSRDKTLRQHLLYHRNQRNIVCEICGFRAINQAKMQRHLKSHNGSRDFSCGICGKSFLYSYNVSAHIKHVHYHEKRPHTDESKLTCSICNKRFPKIWKVTQHMKDVHNIIEEIVMS